MSLEDFEGWFRRESRNFHLYVDENAKGAIFDIEAILSEYHFAGLDERAVPQELAAAIRPFERAEKYLAASFPRQENRAVIGSRSSSGGAPPIPGNNATAGFNVAA